MEHPSSFSEDAVDDQVKYDDDAPDTAVPAATTETSFHSSGDYKSEYKGDSKSSEMRDQKSSSFQSSGFNRTVFVDADQPAEDAEMQEDSENSGVTLCVRNLPINLRNEQIRDEFSRFGEVVDCRVVINPVTKDSRGFGFVSYSVPSMASAAMQKLDGVDLYGNGKPLKIEKAKRNRPHDPTPGEYKGASIKYDVRGRLKPGYVPYWDLPMPRGRGGGRRPQESRRRSLSRESGQYDRYNSRPVRDHDYHSPYSRPVPAYRHDTRYSPGQVHRPPVPGWSRYDRHSPDSRYEAPRRDVPPTRLQDRIQELPAYRDVYPERRAPEYFHRVEKRPTGPPRVARSRSPVALRAAPYTRRSVSPVSAPRYHAAAREYEGYRPVEATRHFSPPRSAYTSFTKLPADRHTDIPSVAPSRYPPAYGSARERYPARPYSPRDARQSAYAAPVGGRRPSLPEGPDSRYRGH